MGTFRTQKVKVVAAIPLLHCRKCDSFCSSRNFVWGLGEINDSSTDMSGTAVNVLDPIYKFVWRRDEKGQILFWMLQLQLLPDSVVFSGASSGEGLYFETDLSLAWGYVKDTCEEDYIGNGIGFEQKETDNTLKGSIIETITGDVYVNGN